MRIAEYNLREKEKREKMNPKIDHRSKGLQPLV
jgi:hypothetical protein